jgi:hypothetical protein
MSPHPGSVKTDSFEPHGTAIHFVPFCLDKSGFAAGRGF